MQVTWWHFSASPDLPRDFGACRDIRGLAQRPGHTWNIDSQRKTFRSHHCLQSWDIYRIILNNNNNIILYYIYLYFQLFSRYSKNRGRTMLFDVVWIRQWHLLCAFAPRKHPTLLPLGVALICLPLDEVRPRVARVHDEQGIELLTKSPLNFLSSSFFIVQIQTTASLLDLRGRKLWDWRNPGHSNYHNPAILTVLNLFETPQLSPQPVASGKALQPSEAMRLRLIKWLGQPLWILCTGWEVFGNMNSMYYMCICIYIYIY